MNTRDIDMLHGSLWDKIILFALPLALTGVMQQLLNAADVFTLGQFVGKHAMAAVGNNISMVGLIVSLMMGLSLGANVVIAQNIGAKRIDRAHTAVNTTFILAAAAGIFFCLLGELLVAPIFYFLEVPASVSANFFARTARNEPVQLPGGDIPQQGRHAHAVNRIGNRKRRKYHAEFAFRPTIRLGRCGRGGGNCYCQRRQRDNFISGTPTSRRRYKIKF